MRQFLNNNLGLSDFRLTIELDPYSHHYVFALTWCTGHTRGGRGIDNRNRGINFYITLEELRYAYPHSWSRNTEGNVYDEIFAQVGALLASRSWDHPSEFDTTLAGSFPTMVRLALRDSANPRSSFNLARSPSGCRVDRHLSIAGSAQLRIISDYHPSMASFDFSEELRSPQPLGQAAKANARARELLVSLLNEVQKKQFESGGTFDVTLPAGWSTTPETFRFHQRTNNMVEHLRTKDNYCVIMPGMPLFDQMAGVKLLLECDTKEFFRIAIKQGTHTWERGRYNLTINDWYLA